MADSNSIETVGLVAARLWPEHEVLTPDVLDRTVNACAWLIGIAQKSVDLEGWDPSIVSWLDSIGSVAYETLQNDLH